MGIEQDIIARMDALAKNRQRWEVVWREIVMYCLPDYAHFNPGSSLADSIAYDVMAREPSSVARGRRRFDDTALRAVDRLAAGMESLVTPQSEKWHGLASMDPLAPDATDEETNWYERYRDFMFAVRYAPRAGFIGAHQKALRSAIALGTGIMFVEESLGAMAHIVPAMYRHLPLSECYLAVDAQSEPDTLYRKFTMTARQMVQRFGEGNLSDNIVRAADRDSEKDRLFQIIHAVEPRQEAGSAGNFAKNAPNASFYLDVDNCKLIGESGFFEFPFVVYSWSPAEESAYAQSPVMMAMSDIKGLNTVKKTSMRGLSQYIDPPMAMSSDGVMNRPNLNPRAINPGALDANGRMRIQPILTMQRPDFVQQIVEAERSNVNDSLYVNLFQILTQNPGMSATEAMIRANEKGELLGPAGGKLQQAMAREVERLSGIIERKGAFHPRSALAPPQSLAGRHFGVRFTSPLDRLRRSAEGIGIQRVLQTVMPLVEADPSVLDNFDLDEIARTTTEIEGAPHKILVTEDVRDAKRAAKAQQAQQAQALATANSIAQTAKAGMPALAQANQMAAQGGGLSPLAPLTPQAPAQ